VGLMSLFVCFVHKLLAMFLCAFIRCSVLSASAKFLDWVLYLLNLCFDYCLHAWWCFVMC
jgi:hypothetical protein